MEDTYVEQHGETTVYVTLVGPERKESFFPPKEKDSWKESKNKSHNRRKEESKKMKQEIDTICQYMSIRQEKSHFCKLQRGCVRKKIHIYCHPCININMCKLQGILSFN